MSKNLWLQSVISVLAMSILFGCNTGEQAEPVQTVAPAQIPSAPVPPQPAVAPQPATPEVVTPPATPLVPIGETVAETSSGSSGSGSSGGKESIDKPLPGKTTTGDELVGNYSCNVDAKGLPLGPFKLPAFGCRIYKSSDDGSLKVGPTAQSAASMNGSISDSTAAGFFIVGQYTFPGNKLGIKARMKLKPGGKVQYSGNGRGRLNDDKKTSINYSLVMTRK